MKRAARSKKAAAGPLHGTVSQEAALPGYAGLTNPVDEALGLVVVPRGETSDIVNQVKEIVAKMTSEETAEFRIRLRELNNYRLTPVGS
jgi:hypothetical protein